MCVIIIIVVFVGFDNGVNDDGGEGCFGYNDDFDDRRFHCF